MRLILGNELVHAVITVVSFHAISGTYNEFTPLIVLVKIVAAVFSIGAVGVE